MECYGMIVEYHRPKKIAEALKLLSRKEIATYPMGGGTILNQPAREPRAVVDLQDLGLSDIKERVKTLEIGATVTLQHLLDFQDPPGDLANAIRHEASYNLRQVATVAGTLVSADGRSPFTTAMLALDAHLDVISGNKIKNDGDFPIRTIALGELLLAREDMLRGNLIMQVKIPRNVGFNYAYVARTPADLPIVCLAVTQWPSGRTRAALGGYGESPKMVMDGTAAAGMDVAAMEAYSQAGDQWASAEYRSEMAGVLARRFLEA
jgi:CO/xanthine dehydrogenase FAD-binding subunit